ncbi:hypothetical protein ROZALSC1DRAFT_29543, partial [Rozella allomycis CSF55]
MKKHRNITLERIQKFISTEYFSNYNLTSVLYKYIRVPETIELSVYHVPMKESRPSFGDVTGRDFVPVKVGQSFGPSWSTHWFKLEFRIPPENRLDDNLYCMWNTGSEGLLFDANGKAIQGLTDQRNTFLVDTQMNTYYIEMACLGMFGNGQGNLIFPPDNERYFTLSECCLVIKNMDAWDLFYDYKLLVGIIENAPPDSQLNADALYLANEIEFFQKMNESLANNHEIIATGHCHIDSAWLWDYSETRRKCARSWSSQLLLMEQYPNYEFVCSQAQQYEWVENDYPELFKRIQDKKREGQFVPIGGSWVEMDCNIPSGESFIRQFIYGQEYFKSRFSERCKVFWLPDTFGYSSQLPQIIKQCGMEYFFTQKLSWNNINKFPHTTFYWKGLDGTRVLTHFSPADTYCSTANPKDILYCVKNNKDKDRAAHSLLVYGHGDGGGGPTEEMLESLQRFAGFEGIKVDMGNPNTFFEALEENSRDLMEWKGELYFELHRGTYTSQAKNKYYNRLCEFKMHNLELLSVFRFAKTRKFNEMKVNFDQIWKNILLNQFHDVLPGSSIEKVYKDSTKIYENVLSDIEQLENSICEDMRETLVVINPWPWELSFVIEMPEKINGSYE